MGRLQELAERISTATYQDSNELVTIETNEHDVYIITRRPQVNFEPHLQMARCKHGKTEAQRKKEIAKRRKKNKNKKTHR